MSREKNTGFDWWGIASRERRTLPDLRGEYPVQTEMSTPKYPVREAPKGLQSIEAAKITHEKISLNSVEPPRDRPIAEADSNSAQTESMAKGTKERIATAIVGTLSERATAVAFNYIFCPAVTLWAAFTFGPVIGASIAFAIISAVSIALDLAFIKSGDLLKRDILGMEIRQEERAGRSKIWDFIYLSTQWSPAYATLFFRKKENKYMKLTSSDYTTMAWSTITANVYEMIPAFIAYYLGPVGMIVLGAINLAVVGSTIKNLLQKNS